LKTHILELRKMQGMTQQDLADKVDASRQTINALEQGRYNPSLLLACRIARTLGKKHVEDVFDVD
jgi:putative transcriptional regulator